MLMIKGFFFVAAIVIVGSHASNVAKGRPATQSSTKAAAQDVALASTGATCETSNNNDPWPRGSDCSRLIAGTDSWGSSTGVHIARTGGWLHIAFAAQSTVSSVTVKQCAASPPTYVSQNFKIEIVDADLFETLHTYNSGVSREQTYTLPTVKAASGVRITITGATASDDWMRLTAVEVMGIQDADKAVDGNVNSDFGHGSCTETTVQENPWWKVDLQQQRTVGLVSITNRGDCCGNNFDLATIKVGDQECGSNLVVPEGETGDFVCDPPLTGSSVTVTLPGQQRSLTLCEVEVYEATTVATMGCYSRDSHASNSATMGNSKATQSCRSTNCTGPGPSQCTACNDDHALVPWRADGSGTCHSYTSAIQVRDMPGMGSAAAALLPSYRAKWGSTSGVVSLPGVTGTAGSFRVELHCYLHKTVMCGARANSTADLACTVEKKARLKSLDDVTGAFSSTGLSGFQTLCSSVSGSWAHGCHCQHIPLTSFSMMFDLPSPHDACTAMLALL